MKLIKDVENISNEDRAEALKIINRLKMGDRVFGNPGYGLKITLKKLEERHEEELKSKEVLDYLDNDKEYNQQCRMLKAGISGEEDLAEFLEKIVKYDKELQDIIFFASLSDPNQNSGGEEYISDSDFIAVYGNNILILDAKNIPTSPDLPIYLNGGNLVGVGGKEILELHPSTFIWERIFNREDINYSNIEGCVVIVNKTGACIWKNQEWYTSNVKPLHISELVDFLHSWIDGLNKDKNIVEVNLSMLISLSKMQIRKEKTEIVDEIRNKMSKFGV